MSALIITDINLLKYPVFHPVVNLVTVNNMVFGKVVNESRTIVNLSGDNHRCTEQFTLLVNLGQYFPKSLFLVFRV